MSEGTEGIIEFVGRRIAPRFAGLVEDARRRLDQCRRELEDLEGACGSIRWRVEELGTVYLNIAGGCMTAEGEPREDLFMTVVQSQADWQRFAAGTVSTGFLGDSPRQRLGKARIQRLRGIRGSIRFVLTDLEGGDWSNVVHFGPEEIPGEPRATIRMAADTARKIQSGDLNPQAAFMQGQVRMEGDAGLAMQVGMAMNM